MVALPAASQFAGDPRIARFSQSVADAVLPPGWTPLSVKAIEPSRHARPRRRTRVVLRAEAAASASALAFAFASPPSDAQRLRWQWKAERLPRGADTTQRATDDAVARVYVTFRHPPERLTTGQRAIDEMMRALLGEVPPHATLLYVWDSRALVGTSRRNAYSDRVHNFVLESGSARLLQWLAYERDVAADYRAAFGEPPPPVIGVALMTDGDNTGSRAIAYYGDITLSAE
jgi:Protein of unknown function (DUF3047)